VQKLLELASHEARGYVVSMKDLVELSPRHLVAIATPGLKAKPNAHSKVIVHLLLELEVP
jgi:hypothetical protein